jgi:hypothetical protein
MSKPKRQYPKKTSEGVAIIPPLGYYARKAHVPAPGARFAVVQFWLNNGAGLFALQHASKFPRYGSHGFLDAIWNGTTRLWWHKHIQESNRFFWNFGIATGECSNLSVVDSDGIKGEESIADVEKLTGIMFPKTVTVDTPSGGKHRYYRYTPALKTCDNLMPKLDIRNDKAYVVDENAKHGNEKSTI